MKRIVTLGLVCAAFGLGGCAQRQQVAFNGHGKEYFPESIYGRASPRVVADGEEVPKGGGRYLVGKPYTVAGHTYVPSERKYAAVGLASWYGEAFHGRRTANGEVYDRESISAAHPTMPLPSYARVTNLRNRRSIIVRVNDRGPYHGGRIMDLSARAAEALDYRRFGTARVKVEYVGRAALAGSDDEKLMATLHMDGRPAQIDDFALSPTEVAERRELPAERQEPAQAARDVERVAMLQPEALPPPRPERLPVNEPRVASDARLTPEELGPVAELPAHPPPPPQRPLDLGER